MKTQPGAHLEFTLDGAPTVGNTVKILARLVAEEGFDLTTVGQVRFVVTPRSAIVEIENCVITHDPTSEDPATFEAVLLRTGRADIDVKAEHVASGDVLQVVTTALKVNAAK